MADDQKALIKELERDGWWCVIDERFTCIAVHTETEVILRFGRHPNLRGLRAEAAAALGQAVPGKASSQRRRARTNKEHAEIAASRARFARLHASQAEAEQLRTRVIQRDRELRMYARMMQPGR